MDVATDTPIGTPTKCGCTGGIVVSCGTGSMPRNRPSPTLRRRYQIMPPPECPMCAEEALNKQYRAVKSAALNEALAEGNVVNDHSSDVKGANSGRERRSYAAMLRGALGRWSGKKRRPTTKNRETALPNHYSQVPNSCTNNNCESPDQCKLNTSDEARRKLTTHPVRINGEGYTGNENCTVPLDPKPEREGHEAKGLERNARNKSDACEQSNPAVNHTRTQASLDGSACNKDVTNRNGRACQKLPSLPYREEQSKAKSSETGAVDNTKRRRGKRKYFSSPIHRKEPNRDSTGDIQSTYVSFQDELAKDVQLNVQQSPAMAKSSSRKTSWSRLATQRKRSDSDVSPAEVSPTTLSDDVFTESPNNRSPTAQKVFPTPDTRHGVRSERGTEDDALIERLFHKVNAAFGAPGSKRSNSESVRQVYAVKSRHHTYNYDEKSSWSRADTRPTPGKYMTSGRKDFHHEPIDAIMASANLHASLDNAMCMLSESTKLLSPLDQTDLLQPDYAARHNAVSGGNLFLASHQPFRPRTYSTCSRLETIAEENDRTEDSTPDLDRKDNEDVTSCAYSDASEYEKAMLHHASRNDRDSIFSATTKTSFDSDYASASLQRRHAEAVRDDSQVSMMDEYDQKTRLLLQSCPNSTIRRQSTSTISIRGVPRSHHETPSSEVLGQVFGPTTEDKCVACEWARRSQLHFQTVPVIPTSAWPRIVNSSHQCKDSSHFHPWGVCAHRHDPPVLCHSHYLQYYQYLQRHPKPGKHHRQPLRSVSSQGDSLIDYDINEVISSLDELVTSNPSSAHSSTTNIFRSHYHHAIAADQHIGHDDHHKMQMEERYSAHYLDVRHYNKQQTHKKSDTDVSVNSDSAFSTNGSLTPSTRDGVNTDRDSIDSMTDGHHVDQDMLDGRKSDRKLCGQLSPEGHDHIDGVHNLPPPSRTFIARPGCEHSWVASRGQRTQSYEDTKPQKSLLSASDCPDKRYSVVSSVGSSSPLTSDPLCDSAVHLQDNCSSHSTQLSSDSFYSTGTSHGEKDACLLDRALSLHSISRSSSEASLNSEGTLCLSDYAVSQQNIALSCAHSFPQINEICSPVRAVKPGSFPQNPNTLQNNRLAKWIEQSEISETVLETFSDEESHFAATDAGTIKPNVKKQDPIMEAKGFFDTLASSSGSSDSNTLGSGSSGSTYATSSLRSYMSNSRFNTFDSSSCVSTDDTGETVIDQYTLRQSGRLHDIDEMPPSGVRVRRKRSGNDDKKRYRASAFHYENLDMPQYVDCDVVDDVCSEDSFKVAVSKGVAQNMRIKVSRVRSSSTSCITTSVTRVSCVVRQCKSLSDIQETECDFSTLFQKIEISHSKTSVAAKTDGNSPAIIYEQNWSPKSSAILQTKVESMIQNCNDFDNIIASLRESLRRHTTSEDSLDRKLLELGEILKQKDEVINQLHSMLLMSYAYSRHPLKYSANATI